MDTVNLVPGFILKLWKMVNDPNCDDLIAWSDNGQSFIILDPARFSQELSRYFKHNNLSSFIRQLNMYGFRKVATIDSGLLPGSDDLHFYHPDFIRGRQDRLESIKRKLPQKIAETVDLKNVYKGITEIEDKQKDVTNTLSELKRENEMLWTELHDLRQKHEQQQHYISRLMKLVVEVMEQNGIQANMLSLKHNTPLMIEGAVEDDIQLVEGTKMDTSEPAQTTDPVYLVTTDGDQQQLNEQMLTPTATTTTSPMSTETMQPVTTYTTEATTSNNLVPAVRDIEESIIYNGDQIDNLASTITAIPEDYGNDLGDLVPDHLLFE